MKPMVMLPLAILLAGAYGVFLIARLLRGGQRRAAGSQITDLELMAQHHQVMALLTTGVGLLAGVWLVPLWRAAIGSGPLAWGSAGPFGVRLRADPLGLFMAALAVGLGSLVTLYSARYMSRDGGLEYYYPLLLLMMGGMVGIALAADLFNLYLFCELMSISSYALVAFRKERGLPVEAGFKYLVMGGVGSAMVLLGISLVYRATGQLDLVAIEAASNPIAWLSVPFFIVGFGIKAALVPLHTWLPDAHGEAPSGISAMLSGVVIQSGFYALLRVLLALGFPGEKFGLLLVAFALLGMTVGNLMALVQTKLKRMLAYSSVAQVGYILLGLGMGMHFGAVSAMLGGLFHLLTHAAMKGLSFLCAGAIAFETGLMELEEMEGVGYALPLVGAAFGLAVLGLAGLPPLAGFMSKWLIFKGGMEARSPLGYVCNMMLLANSLLSLGYYLPALGVLFSRSNPRQKQELSRWLSAPILILAALVLILGLYPRPGLALVLPAQAFVFEMLK
jgi:proton-translocating NADH-quinone oxidoreductase chain N